MTMMVLPELGFAPSLLHVRGNQSQTQAGSAICDVADQVCNGTGSGCDWAVGRRADQTEDESDAQPPPPRRVSLILYLATEEASIPVSSLQCACQHSNQALLEREACSDTDVVTLDWDHDCGEQKQGTMPTADAAACRPAQATPP